MLKGESLERARPASVHFVMDTEWRKYSFKKKMFLAELDWQEGFDEDAIFEGLSLSLNFPEYFGKNWDALFDCLKDLEWIKADGFILNITNASMALQKNPCAIARLLNVWQSANEFWIKFEVPFHLVLSMECDD